MSNYSETIKNTKNDKLFNFPYLTKYERARILGVRARQIDSGAVPFIDITDLSDKSSLNIAIKELEMNKLFLLIKRDYSNGKSDVYKLTNLTINN